MLGVISSEPVRRHWRGSRAVEAATPPPPPPGRSRGRSITWSTRGTLLAAGIGALVALPWLDQRLVWCGWLGVAGALLVADRIRGWHGEILTVASALIAIAIAFHWTPEALATALATDRWFGVAVATPIAAWDALRLAAPFLLVGRLGCRPHEAWLPAALAAVVAEAVMPGVFPWTLGSALVAWPPLVQSVEILGSGGATFVFFAHAGLLAAVFDIAGRSCGRLREARPRMSRPGRLALAVCVANDLSGVVAAAAWQRSAAAAPVARLAVVQADPGDPDGLDALRSLTAMACADGRLPPALVCWPECSGGCYADTLTSLADPAVVLAHSRPPLAGLRPWEAPSRPLLFGGKLYSGHPDKPRAVHQAALLVDTAERTVGSYRKRQLMPFGEYVPGGDWLPELASQFAMQEEFARGAEATVLHVTPALRVGVLLCSEDMLPEAARSLVDNSANVLVSLINGAAFPQTITLAQHRMLSQLRAVENRRALVRCAATGETCVISPEGRIVASLPVRDRGLLVADVPLLDTVNPARRLGRVFPLACGVGLAFEMARRWRGRRPAHHPPGSPP
ncbi:MAG: apolipoprotein N-acyltransferase [Planctomycetes bacterium]|nr:apolipoprotein N-acyltransferase [Planctomycetota bacterium]